MFLFFRALNVLFAEIAVQSRVGWCRFKVSPCVNYQAFLNISGKAQFKNQWQGVGRLAVFLIQYATCMYAVKSASEGPL